MPWTGTPGTGSLTMDGVLAVALGTITTDVKVLDGSATWNAAGVTFAGLKLNVTDTASAAGSLLFDLQVGGASKFQVRKDGQLAIKGHFVPIDDILQDLGNSSFRWRDLRLGGTATWTGNGHLFRSLTGTATVLDVIQGDNTSTVTPTAPALGVTTRLNATIDTTFIAHRGDIFADAGTGGTNIGVQGLAEALGTGTWSTGGTAPGLFGLVGYGVSARGGRVWGGNVTARTTAIAAADASGFEIDLDTRIATTNRYGLTIAAVTNGTVQGTTDDQMVRLINKTGGALWKDGIVFGGAGGIFPIATTGAVFRSIGADTVATGIDLSSLTITGTLLAGGGYIEGQEMTAPGAPAANRGRMFFEDNGAGKTRLMVRFPTGANQQVAIEP